MTPTAPRDAGSVEGARIGGPPRLEQSDPADAGAPTMLGVRTPRVTWTIVDAAAGWSQTRAELRIRRADGTRQTAVVEGGNRILVEWPFAPLASRERFDLSVRSESADGWTGWSPVAAAEVSLLDPADWRAAWISPLGAGGIGEPAPVLGTRVEVGAGLAWARLHLTALGLVDARINGRPVTRDLLVPGWTSYDRLVRFRSYDVTALLHAGANDLRAALGNGWYRGRVASLDLHRGEPYGERLALLAQLELEYADGRRETIGTDAGWRAASSGILADDFYDGQTTDLRVPEVELDHPVEVREQLVGPLRPAVAPPVRELESLAPVCIERADDTVLLDFGRVIVGWLRLHVATGSEREVVVRHAEVLEDGRLAMRPLRSALATDRWFTRAGDHAVLEPRFTYHGFRFATVSGLGSDELLKVEAVVIGSALRRTGWLETSDAHLNRLHANVVASMVGNFVDIPTDCPQRDERLGWTGDVQIFAPTATTLFDVSTFLGSWLESLALDQLPDGTVPATVPRVFREERPLAGWGDAAVTVPGTLYQRYGDLDVVRRQYASMRAWVDKVRSLTDDDGLWRGGDQLGDWLDPLAPPDDPAAAQADPDVVASAYFAQSARILADCARLLGESADAARYGDLARTVRVRFGSEFVDERGRIRSDCQTVYAMALAWDLIDDPDRRRGAGDRLAELVRSQGHTVATGFLGTPLVLHALSIAGRVDDAYSMLTTHAFPSWLYAVDLGATTIWERWDSLLADGSVNSGEMTSFTHYAFGAVANWMHRNIGGLTQLAPACRLVRVAPRPGGGITSAALTYDCPYGRIAVAWRIESDGVMTLDLALPVGVTASVELPDGDVLEGVGHGIHRYRAVVPRAVAPAS
jgi:alpha-L-rhamnosidase